ncbi:MAG TPA: hypothetical protein VD815_09910 [Candidatus Saccharimonadales bacterium]|nr:hypothetical protein [Candidatus Saccharimonadales bacterium]
MRLPENYNDRKTQSQTFDLWIMKLNKHGQELEGILKIGRKKNYFIIMKGI